MVAVVIAAVAGGFFYFHKQHAAAVTFNSAAVARGTLTQTVTATGILNPDKSVQVGCQVSGRISEIFADFNSRTYRLTPSAAKSYTKRAVLYCSRR